MREDCNNKRFQSTLPAWGATTICGGTYVFINFNPRSPHGERLLDIYLSLIPKQFQSTLPAWGATLEGGATLAASDFNPRSPHGERPERIASFAASTAISIHAPRMGSDSTVKAYSNDRIKWSTLREPHFFYSKNACFSPIVSMCATTSRTKKSENQSFIRIISRLGPYVFHLRLVSVPQIIEPYAVRLLVHQHFQCGTK